MTHAPMLQIYQNGSLAIVFTLTLMLSACGRDKQWDLSEAARRGDLAEVKRLYEAGADLDAIPQDGYSEGGTPALHEAVSGGHDEVVQFLLDHKVEMEMAISDCGPPLAGALRHHSIAKLLLEYGASANHAIGHVLNPNNWTPPLDQETVELLKKYGAITKTTFKRVPPSSFLCTGKVISESEIPAFLNQQVPAIYAGLKAVGATPSGLLHVNYTGRNLRHPGPFYIEIAVPFDNDKYQVPSGFYFRTANEFKCFAGDTSGALKNIRYGESIIESQLWAQGRAYPTYDMREVFKVWKSAESSENIVEIQLGIHRPARDANGKSYQEQDNFGYEVGE